MKKILGLDLGTNSIGWAVLTEENGEISPPKDYDYGVHIFPAGFGIEKNNEYSLAAERTGFRSARKLKIRRRIRKIQTLTVLSENNLCPKLTSEELKNWRNSKQYIANEKFRNWLLTDDALNKNPYYYRHIVVKQKLDLKNLEDAYKLGRALYHIAQRRGFKSNRLDSTTESDGKVNSGINELQEKKGDLTLGQYFWSIYDISNKIRNQYTSREKDYEAEFNKICEVQEITADLKHSLWRAIFYQRPLKSQKGAVANCPFEPTKKCIPISHPLFELFRMYSFVNGIRAKFPDDLSSHELNTYYQQKAVECFLVKTDFTFEKIAKAFLPNKKTEYCTFKEARQIGDNAPKYQFNYTKETTISCNKTITQLCHLFEVKSYEDLLEAVKNKFTQPTTKSGEELLFEIWHFLTIAGDEKNRLDFAKNKYGFSVEKAREFDNIRLVSGYASLSQKAISLILPYLKQGLIYSHAVFMAKIPTFTTDKSTDNLNKISVAINDQIKRYSSTKKIAEILNSFIDKNKNKIAFSEDEFKQAFIQALGVERWESYPETKKKEVVEEQLNICQQQKIKGNIPLKIETLQERIVATLLDPENNFSINLNPQNLGAKLYHPSAIEKYKQAEPADDGKRYLGSPRISAIKNPAFMRSMFRLRALINQLIKAGKIDSNTSINIEMTRELNDANKRAAIKRYQDLREKENSSYRAKIEELMPSRNVTDEDIMKYRLWEEQKRECIYTGKEIAFTDVFSANPSYDIEHTFPRSRGGDNSLENKTLTDARFNRELKNAKIPSELANYPEVKSRLQTLGWQKIIDREDKKIQDATKRSKSATTKDAKDKAIVERHVAKMTKEYYLNKLFKFNAVAIPQGFARNQLTNTQMLCKYAISYLSSVFDRTKISSYKFQAIKHFYQAWGVKDKTRDWHLHHCIDALIVASISQKQYDKIAHVYRDKDCLNSNQKIAEPWQGFSQLINVDLENHIFVTHHVENDLFKQTKKKVRVRGKIKKDADGKPLYQKGTGVRGRLHKETFYGKILQNDKIVCVTRKKLDDTTKVDSIIDPAIRQAVKAGKIDGQYLMPSGVPIKKVRCKDSVANPLELKSQLNQSHHAHKQNYYVANESNYAVAIYGDLTNPNCKKHITSKEVISSFAAVEKHNRRKMLFPDKDKKNFNLRGLIKIGSKILLYEKSPAELKTLTPAQLIQRLYIVYGIEGDGCMSARNHQSNKVTRGKSVSDYKKIEETIRFSSANMLIEGKDFTINMFGEITFKI